MKGLLTFICLVGLLFLLITALGAALGELIRWSNKGSFHESNFSIQSIDRERGIPGCFHPRTGT
jgi:hypothetical protein